MTSIGTLRIGKAAWVPVPVSLTLHCLAIPSEPPELSRRTLWVHP